MTNSPLEQALDRYRTSLEPLKDDAKLAPDGVLTILNARDAVGMVLKSAPTVPTSALGQLLLLDEIFREKAGCILRILKDDQLAQWRQSVNPPAEAWWWWLEKLAPPHPLNRLDGLWKLMMVAGWTANITLIVNLAARFLGGGVGLEGVAAVALPSILALLQVGSEFTKAGQVGFEKFLATLRIPSQWREEAKLVTTLAMSGLLVGIWFCLPEFSQRYNRSGVENYQQGKFGEAEQDFRKAIALNADNADAHYNLGSLYEDLQQFDAAKKEYLMAIAGNFPDAYNNLARLYIKEKKYSQAAALLIQGIDKFSKEREPDPKVRYDLHKNLGWVRLQQERYEEAQTWLNMAIALANTPQATKFVQSSEAHCLLAQVLEKQHQPALAQWQQCQRLGSVTNPDEDGWLHQARQKLKPSAK